MNMICSLFLMHLISYRLRTHGHDHFQYKMGSAGREPEEFLLRNRFLKAILDASCILQYSRLALIKMVVMIKSRDKSDSLKSETNIYFQKIKFQFLKSIRDLHKIVNLIH